MTTSKINRDQLYELVNEMLTASTEKKRNFLESVELQVSGYTFKQQSEPC